MIFIFPELVFDGDYSDNDQILYTQVVNSIAYSYYQKTSSPMFGKDWKCTITQNSIENGEDLGKCWNDHEVTVWMPKTPSFFELRAYSNLVGHEIAHMLIWQHYQRQQESNNLVHFAANLAAGRDDNRYFYTAYRNFVNLPILQLDMNLFDLRLLIRDHDWIMANCWSLRGSNIYIS